MDLIYGCGGSAGWRSIFEDAMQYADDATDAGSITSLSLSKVASLPVAPKLVIDTVTTQQTSVLNSVPSNIDITPANVGNSHVPKNFNDNVSMLDNDNLSYSFSSDMNFVFKVVDASTGNTFRIRCDFKMDKLLSNIAEKVGRNMNDGTIWKLTFVDEDGDTVLLKDDDCLVEAVHVVKTTGKQALRITVEYTGLGKVQGGGMDPIKESTEGGNSSSNNDTMLLIIGGAVVAVGAIILMTMSRKK